jgi:hypothetical protein
VKKKPPRERQSLVIGYRVSLFRCTADSPHRPLDVRAFSVARYGASALDRCSLYFRAMRALCPMAHLRTEYLYEE